MSWPTGPGLGAAATDRISVTVMSDPADNNNVNTTGELLSVPDDNSNVLALQTCPTRRGTSILDRETAMCTGTGSWQTDLTRRDTRVPLHTTAP